MKKTDQELIETFEQIYQNAMMLFNGGFYSEAAKEFARIPDYEDAAERKTECEELIAKADLDGIYEEADKAAANMNVRSQEKAIVLFESIPGYRDSEDRIEQAKQRIEQIKEKEKADREEGIRIQEQNRKKAKERRKLISRVAVMAVLAAAACIAGVFLFKKYAVPAIKYDRGIKQMQAGEYDDAYRTLHGLNYKDSSDIVYTIAHNRLQDNEVGSTVLFGMYPQGSSNSDEAEPIEWIVLAKDGSRLLLISKYALDAVPYMSDDFDPSETSVTWTSSRIREWLNDDFVNTAFDEGELRLLMKTWVKTAVGPYNTQSTADRVFLLSTDEAELYFADDASRECVATRYALRNGAYRSSIEPTCLWWLRSPAYTDEVSMVVTGECYEPYRIACIGTSGQIVEIGHGIRNRYAIRPVIWVDMESTGELVFGK